MSLGKRSLISCNKRCDSTNTLGSGLEKIPKSHNPDMKDGGDVVGASAGSLPLSRVRPEKPCQLGGSWIPAHEEPRSIFGLLHPTHSRFPWSVR